MDGLNDLENQDYYLCPYCLTSYPKWSYCTCVGANLSGAAVGRNTKDFESITIEQVRNTVAKLRGENLEREPGVPITASDVLAIRDEVKSITKRKIKWLNTHIIVTK